MSKESEPDLEQYWQELPDWNRPLTELELAEAACRAEEDRLPPDTIRNLNGGQE